MPFWLFDFNELRQPRVVASEPYIHLCQINVPALGSFLVDLVTGVRAAMHTHCVSEAYI